MRTEYFTYTMMRNWIQNDMVEDGFVFFSMRSNTNGLTKQLIELNNASMPTATKYFEELHSITLSALCNKIRKYALQERVRVFIIDNFNSIVADGVHNSRSERQFISWSLLQLARELDIIIIIDAILFSHYGVEYRRQAPILADLGYEGLSGDLDVFSDVVFGFWSPEKLHIFENYLGEDLHDAVEIEILKNVNNDISEGRVLTLYLDSQTKCLKGERTIPDSRECVSEIAGPF